MDANSEKNQLYRLVELLFVPMAFYVLTQFDKIDTWQRGVLWFVVFALVQNEYLSIIISKAKYNIWLYLLEPRKPVRILVCIESTCKTSFSHWL